MNQKYVSVVFKISIFVDVKPLTEKLFHMKLFFMSIFNSLHQHPVPVPFRVILGHFLTSFT